MVKQSERGEPRNEFSRVAPRPLAVDLKHPRYFAGDRLHRRASIAALPNEAGGVIQLMNLALPAIQNDELVGHLLDAKTSARRGASAGGCGALVESID